MRDVLELFRYFVDKRYSTIGGTLVYFFIMSVTPFLFWLTLIVGNVSLEQIMSNELFSAVEPLISYLNESATSATSGAGIILIITSLWSSTSFFYHLRKSGEIIYDFSGSRGGVKLRIRSAGVVFLTIIIVAGAAATPVFGSGVLKNIMPEVLAEIISLVFLILFAFFIAYLLNVFACPYRLSFEDTVGGVTFTVLLWIVFASAFTVYLKYANPQKLYGAVAAVIVFMLWCYLMMNSLVIGIIYNRKYSGKLEGNALINKNPTAKRWVWEA